MAIGRIGIGILAATLISAATLTWAAWAKRNRSQPAPIPAGFQPPDIDARSIGWPCFAGPFHNNVSAERNVRTEWPEEGPPELWRREIGTGYSSPVVHRQRLIVCYRRDEALPAGTEQRTSTDANGELADKEPPAGREFVECFNAVTGESIWAFEYRTSFECRYDYSDGPYSTPVIAGDRVYAVGAQGQIHCLSLESGELIWRRQLHREYAIPEALFAVGASPLLEGERLIFNLGAVDAEASIIAIDCQDGHTVWTALDHKASYATPVAATIHEQRYVFVVTFDGLVALDPSDGTVFWVEEFQSRAPDSVNATSPAVDGDRVVMVTGPGPGAICVQVLPNHEHQLLWQERRVLDSQFNSLLIINGYLYGYSSRRYGGASFRCVDMDTGKLQWKWQSVLDRGSAIAVADRFIMWGENGHLGSLDVNPHQLSPRSMTAQPMLAKPCYAAPALEAGRLYLRNETTLLCLDLRVPEPVALVDVQ